MKTSDNAVQMIKNFEGLSTKAYLCPAGHKTIGYGHVLLQGENRDYINQKEAEDLLFNDLSKIEYIVQRNIQVELNQGQFDALISFTFNLGAASLQRSTLRQKINRYEHEDVPKEFMRWIYAGGKILAGLVARRRAEAEMYVMG